MAPCCGTVGATTVLATRGALCEKCVVYCTFVKRSIAGDTFGGWYNASDACDAGAGTARWEMACWFDSCVAPSGTRITEQESAGELAAGAISMSPPPACAMSSGSHERAKVQATKSEKKGEHRQEREHSVRSSVAARAAKLVKQLGLAGATRWQVGWRSSGGLASALFALFRGAASSR